MSRKNSQMSMMKIIFICFAVVFGLVALAMLYKAANTSTEQRSKAGSEETILKNWEFNTNELDGWRTQAGQQLTVKDGYLYIAPKEQPARRQYYLKNTSVRTSLPAGLKSLKILLAIDKYNVPLVSQPETPVFDKEFNDGGYLGPPVPVNQMQLKVQYLAVGQKGVNKPLFIDVIPDGKYHDYSIQFPEIDQVYLRGLAITISGKNIAASRVYIDWIRLVSTIPIKPTSIDECGPVPTGCYRETVQCITTPCCGLIRCVVSDSECAFKSNGDSCTYSQCPVCDGPVCPKFPCTEAPGVCNNQVCTPKSEGIYTAPTIPVGGSTPQAGGFESRVGKTDPASKTGF